MQMQDNLGIFSIQTIGSNDTHTSVTQRFVPVCTSKAFLSYEL